MKIKSKAARLLFAVGLGVTLGWLAVSVYADSGTGGPKAIPNTDISFTWAPSVLWPPDHSLRTIVITGHDARETPVEAGTYSLTVTSITANEDDCGDTGGPDWIGVGNTSGEVPVAQNALVAIQLRGERCGNSAVGRTYTVTVRAVDDELVGGVRRTGTATFTVTVPHDQGQ
jgi:hypothetical protein